MACGDDFWILSIQRTPEQGPFTPDEQEQLVNLSARLSSAAALARALGFARAEAALAAFEASGSAAALLDRAGKLFRANAAAEALLGPDLQISGGRLVSADHLATMALERTLHELLWTRSSSALMPPVVLPRREKRPLLAYLMRLSGVTRDGLAPCQAVLVLDDHERQALPPLAHVRAAFGLSAAEARLTEHLATGASLDDAAERLGIARETARSQLKAVFAKTGTGRQAELVALTSRLSRLRHPPYSGGAGSQ